MWQLIPEMLKFVGTRHEKTNLYLTRALMKYGCLPTILNLLRICFSNFLKCPVPNLNCWWWKFWMHVQCQRFTAIKKELASRVCKVPNSNSLGDTIFDPEVLSDLGLMRNMVVGRCWVFNELESHTPSVADRWSFWRFFSSLENGLSSTLRRGGAPKNFLRNGNEW